MTTTDRLARPAATQRSPGESARDIAPPAASLTGSVMTPAQVLALQRTVGNAAVQRVLARQPQPPGQGHTYKPNAHKALDDLGPKLEDMVAADRRWLSGNYIDYYGRVSQNPRLSWTEDVAYGALSNTLGNAASFSVQTFLERGARKAGAAATGAAIGGAVGNLPGAVLGFVLGVVIETAVGFLLDRITNKASAEDKAAADASSRTADLIANQEKALDAHEDRGKQAARQRISAARAKLDATKDHKVVEAIWADAVESAKSAKKPSRDDRGLMETLLKDWVREHAGDEEDANKETSEAQWESARERAFGKGDSLDNHPEIFAYQSRLHWRGLGLSPDWGTGMVRSVNHLLDVQGMLKRIGFDVQVIKRVFDGESYEFTRTSNPNALIALLERHVRPLSDAGKAAIQKNRFTLKVEMDLEEDDGAVYVDHWRYRFTFTDGDDEWWWKQYISRDPSVKFEVSPD
jgi:hypothetical protein